ncbi:MAG: S-layer homology domain-containing protein [Lachnospirales bacterium]
MKRKIPLMLAGVIALNSTVVLAAEPVQKDSQKVVAKEVRSGVQRTSDTAVEGADSFAIGSETYETLQEAVDVAENGATITITENVTIDVSEDTLIDGADLGVIFINNKNLTIEGKGNTITVDGDLVNGVTSFIQVSGAADVTISDLTLKNESDVKHGIHVYESNATLENVTVSGFKGTALTVNGSTVTATGFNTSGNGWGAVNVTKGKVVTKDPNFTLVSGSLGEDSKIWTDADGEDATVEMKGWVVTPETEAWESVVNENNTKQYIWNIVETAVLDVVDGEVDKSVTDMITSTEDLDVKVGSEVIIKPVEDYHTGFEFGEWTGIEGTVDVNNTLTFDMPDSNTTVTANYKDVQAPTIKVDEKHNGTVGEEFKLPTPTTSDNADDKINGHAVSVEIEITHEDDDANKIHVNGVFTPSHEGTYTITYTATDEAVNSAEATAILEVSAAAVEEYTVTVKGGKVTSGSTTSGAAIVGASVTVEADKPEEGKEFDKWEVKGVTVVDVMANPLTFTMPEGDVTLTATYKDAEEVVDPEEDKEYTVTVNGGKVTSGITSGAAIVGASVTVEADEPEEGKEFDKWEVEGVTVDDVTANPLTFTMPEGDVTLTAVYKDAEEDKEAPVIKLDKTEFEITLGEEFTLPTATVTDNVDEEVSYVITLDGKVVEGTYKPTEAGTYEFVYTATDEAGNESSVTVKLTVTEEDTDTDTDTDTDDNDNDSDSDNDNDNDSGSSSNSSDNTDTDDEDDDVIIKTVFDVVGEVDESGNYVVGLEDDEQELGLNSSTNEVTINVKDVPSDSNVVSVDIPNDKVQELSDVSFDSILNVNVEGFGNVSLNNSVVSQLASGEGDNVNVSLTKNEGSLVIAISNENGLITNVKDGVKVELPELGYGDVLVAVDQFGNETIVKKSVVENGTAYALLNGSCELKVVNNSKEFNDVSDSSWFDNSVDFVTSHELFEGVSQGEFAPNENMSRAMLATVLMRLDDGNSGTSSFDDVPSNAWYADSVGWAANAGVINGTGDGNFRPNDDITREQLAVMMYNYANYANLDTSSSSQSYFNDSAEVSFWASDAMDWAITNGLIQGSNNNLNPSNNATRAEVSAVVERFVSFMVK